MLNPDRRGIGEKQEQEEDGERTGATEVMGLQPKNKTGSKAPTMEHLLAQTTYHMGVPALIYD